MSVERKCNFNKTEHVKFKDSVLLSLTVDSRIPTCQEELIDEGIKDKNGMI